MATVSAPQTPNLNGAQMVDPTRPGEYPILLGDKLAGRDNARNRQFVNVTYNYKTKGNTPQQKTTIYPAGAPDRYKLTIQSKAGNAEQTDLTYVYSGGVDPESSSSTASKSETSNLVLIFDPRRKAFILEPVSTRLNFNLKSAPGKTDRQVSEQYPQLSTSFSNNDQAAGDKQGENESEEEDVGPADEENPYDYRHFLPKNKAEQSSSSGAGSKQSAVEAGSAPGTPDPHLATSSKPAAPRSVPAAQVPPAATAAAAAAAPAAAKAKPKPKPKPAPKSKANPLRPPKQRNPKAASSAATAAASSTNTSSGNANNASTKAKEPEEPAAPPVAIALPPKPELVEDSIIPSVETPDLVGTYSASDDEPKRLAGSPGSNIIVDGDLIIDMGSPPPQRPAFKIDPSHFASNNTSANEAGYNSDDEEDVEEPRPSFFGRRPVQEEEEEEEEEDEDEDETMEDAQAAGHADGDEEPADFEDDLVAEMEAALEESAREEEARLAMEQQQQQQHRYTNHVESEDESEVSEEE
ncbi:hypothetical protein H112_07673 [Trichophyton rubrum D6]|nr:uncharacterized protein TERG_00271 [Trichophyton rubrum CBS 118892]EZF11258.1 hypothetical protein H100_07698 [Trichophyton rubrum MR850]EZF38123.1 hypothetical protein H102_07663 [Trichophyton rubrum CBS 100081]EZF48681.1 hypothetical protein H103_07686 [Trichophyton rubrum CBS 288.86]EZF59260.1 hypothetical protein H104_07634 [Trichophyton rubrum CBS 289.86]EZF69999.1 hypothetical protein H105_07688 [Trichophyton soudanense CBS 452.61]EZF80638.1 hypothetical protein H110_07683 [Trichophy